MTIKREEAVDALNLIKSVIEKTRDESILQNWGEVFVFAGIFKLAFSLLTNKWILSEPFTTPLPYVGLWLGYLALLLFLILFFRRKSPGVRTFVEKQIWGIWIVYITACYITAFVNYVLALPHFELMPICALLAAVSWAMMAITISKKFFLASALFVCAIFLMCQYKDYQWIIIGIAWFIALETAGIHYLVLKHRMKKESYAKFL